jgi:hypothetical protein
MSKGGFEIAGKTTAMPSRVLVTVARFPRGSVARIDMAK